MSKARRAHGVRFIPTGVGNTPLPLSASIKSPVHPHGRGEHHHSAGHCHARNGSSPRAWGTRGQTAACFDGRRFIPTGVGNTMITWMPVQ